MGKRIAVVGVGAVGGYTGAHMVRAGEDVSFIDMWPAHVDEMKKNGLRITHHEGEEPFTVKVRALHLTEAQLLAKEAPIDVAFVDADQVVLKVVRNLKPFRASVCRGARDVVELAAGEAERRGLRPGDRLTWAARGVNGAVSESSARAAAAGAPTRRIRVLLATPDDYFLRLARFLLSRNGFTVETTKKVANAVDLVSRYWLDVVVLDASDSLSETARTVAAIKALHPQVSVLLVADDERPKPNGGLQIADKWGAIETLTDDIRRAYATPTE